MPHRSNGKRTACFWKKRLLLPLAALTACSLFAADGQAEEPLYAELGPYDEDVSGALMGDGGDEDGSIGAITPPGGSSAAPEDGSIGAITPPGGAEGSFFSSVAPEAGTDEKLETLMAQLPAYLPSGNGSWAVFVCDLANNAESSLNDQPMQAASLIKLYIMGAVFENYDALTAQYGQSSIDSNLYSMITVSDNDAANALVSCLGGGDSASGMAIVNDFCAAHGYANTSMGRLLLHSSENGDNYTSVSDCGHFLQTVYNQDTDIFPYADAMYSLLKAQTRRNKIPAQMPEGTKVANKTGELADVENDAGIIYDAPNDLIIVVMSEYLSDVGSAQNTVASISRQIYDYYNG